jgi:hypothetical protein
MRGGLSFTRPRAAWQHHTSHSEHAVLASATKLSSFVTIVQASLQTPQCRARPEGVRRADCCPPPSRRRLAREPKFDTAGSEARVLAHRSRSHPCDLTIPGSVAHRSRMWGRGSLNGHRPARFAPALPRRRLFRRLRRGSPHGRAEVLAHLVACPVTSTLATRFTYPVLQTPRGNPRLRGFRSGQQPI